jgi:predicted anti-sigma-YlaC factor YlaD
MTTHKADCAWYRELASGELDGELTLDEDRALDRHLAGCAECRDARRRVRRTVRLVRALLRWRAIGA